MIYIYISAYKFNIARSVVCQFILIYDISTLPELQYARARTHVQIWIHLHTFT